MLFTEVFWVLLSEHFIKMFACVSKLIGTRKHQRIVGNVDDTLKCGHLGSVYRSCHHIAHKEQLGLRVVHDVVHLVGGKLV